MVRRLENRARTRLEAGEVALGVGIILGRTVDTAVILKNCGYDWLFLDLEHGALSLETASQLAMIGNAIGIAPIVRVPVGGYGLATRILDCGAYGIVMPHVENAAEARALVDACRFPPTGHRGVGGGIPQYDYEAVKLGDAVKELNRTMLIAVMVETAQAVARADEIAAVEGVDIVMIGTNDLAMELGHPQQFDHPEVIAAYETVGAACRKHGKWLGSGGVRDPKIAERFMRIGARFYLSGQDTAFLISGAKAQETSLRDAAVKAKG